MAKTTFNIIQRDSSTYIVSRNLEEVGKIKKTEKGKWLFKGLADLKTLAVVATTIKDLES